MYSVNSIDLKSSEYEELKTIVEAEKSGEDVEAFTSARLKTAGEFNRRTCETYRGLKNAGLISGFNADNGFYFTGINQSAFDFINDYESKVADEEKTIKDQRRHDYKIASLGIVGGAVSGGIISTILYFAFGI